MEQQIKNFDRNIEQRMNEHEVAPPFGMWNRIAAELEAMPVAATAPVATALIPKRAMVGIIAAALILGTTVLTGYLVNSSINSKGVSANSTPANNTIGATTKSTVTNTPTQQTVAVKNEVTTANPVVMKPKVHHNVASNPVQSTILAAQQVTPVINDQPTAPATSGVAINNATTDVPTPIEPIAQNVTEETQTYYFPPIDVNTPEKTKAANESPIVAKKNTKAGTTASSDNDGPDHKIKFRMHNRKRGWAYGNIIR